VVIRLKKKISVPIDYAALNKLILKDLTKNIGSNMRIKNHTKEDVQKYLENPGRFEKELREISNILYTRSPHYRRLIDYFSKMPLFYYILEPYGFDPEKVNVKTLRTQYIKGMQFVELMNIKHEFLKILDVCFREDVFYGYEHMTKDAYFIQKLNPDFCTISSIEDGCYNFAFDFSYFDKNKEQLDGFPPEFKKLYNRYKKDKNLRWQELDSNKTICIKINEMLDAVIPPFAGIFEDVYDINEFKAIRKSNERVGNFKVLVQRLPMNDDGEEINDFLIDFETMMVFHNKAAEALPDEVGLITTPMEVKDFSFEKKVSDNDAVAKAESGLWSGSGVSQSLFGSATGNIGLDKSIRTDEELVFGVLRQIERWVNRRIKRHLGSNCMFRINILNITVFNENDFFEKVLKGAQFGLPTKTMAAASLGISPSVMVSMAFLENEVLGLTDMLEPLVSSHTQTTGDKGGRPEKKESELSPEGARAKDTGKGKGDQVSK
jgi:hypothetical protein